MAFSHAIVLGCGYAGMLAANTLANHFNKVTILERHNDIFSTQPNISRMGIPQAKHLHVLLHQGQELLNQFMPGILEEIGAAQCPKIDWTLDTRWYGPFGVYPQYASDVKIFGVSRAYLDYSMIQRIKTLSNVTILNGDVTKLLCTSPGDKMGIVQFRRPDSDQIHTLHADLIVDARGRRSNISDILNEAGFQTETPLKVTNELSYASRFYQFIDNKHHDFKQFYLQVRPGKTKRGVVISPIENNRAIVTLIGLHDEKPPRDTKLFDQYLYSLPNTELQNFLQHLEPTGDVSLCRNLHNVHFRFGNMKKWPQGLIVIGDAACILNPVYGQGMTVIAKEILLLQTQLELLQKSSTLSSMNWEKTFQEHVDKLLQLPWSMATAEDQRTLSKKSLPLSLRLMHKYYDGVLRLAVKNPRMHHQLTRVLHMKENPSVFFKPRTMLKVLFNHFMRTS